MYVLALILGVLVGRKGPGGLELGCAGKGTDNEEETSVA